MEGWHANPDNVEKTEKRKEKISKKLTGHWIGDKNPNYGKPSFSSDLFATKLIYTQETPLKLPRSSNSQKLEI